MAISIIRISARRNLSENQKTYTIVSKGRSVSAKKAELLVFRFFFFYKNCYLKIRIWFIPSIQFGITCIYD